MLARLLRHYLRYKSADTAMRPYALLRAPRVLFFFLRRPRLFISSPRRRCRRHFAALMLPLLRASDADIMITLLYYLPPRRCRYAAAASRHLLRRQRFAR